jgi:hypothetical protein
MAKYRKITRRGVTYKVEVLENGTFGKWLPTKEALQKAKDKQKKRDERAKRRKEKEQKAADIAKRRGERENRKAAAGIPVKAKPVKKAAKKAAKKAGKKKK